MAMPISASTSTSSPLPLLFLRHSPNPKSTLSFPSSFRPSPPPPLRSRGSATPPTETLPDEEILDTSPTAEGSGLPMPLSIVDDTEKLLLGATAGQESIRRPCAQLHMSLSDSYNISQEKIVIRNSYGENLVGVLHEGGSKYIVVLCHGFRSSKESRTILNLADALTSEKISTFRFDFAGNGESEGVFQYGSYWREVDNLRAVILYLKKHKRDVCAIAGHSKGGNVVILYASVYQDISAVINISGRFDLERGIEDRLGKDYMERIKQYGFIDVRDKMGRPMYRVTEESLMDRLKTDMHAACVSIGHNCRVLTVHGSEDDVVPSKDALEFDKYISSHKLLIIEGANHRYTSHQLELADIVLRFITSG